MHTNTIIFMCIGIAMLMFNGGFMFGEWFATRK